MLCDNWTCSLRFIQAIKLMGVLVGWSCFILTWCTWIWPACELFLDMLCPFPIPGYNTTQCGKDLSTVIVQYTVQVVHLLRMDTTSFSYCSTGLTCVDCWQYGSHSPCLSPVNTQILMLARDKTAMVSATPSCSLSSIAVAPKSYKT